MSQKSSLMKTPQYVPGALTSDINNSLSELLTHASQEGADTEIDLGGGDAVTLVGVNMGDLHEDDDCAT